MPQPSDEKHVAAATARNPATAMNATTMDARSCIAMGNTSLNFARPTAVTAVVANAPNVLAAVSVRARDLSTAAA